MGTAQFDMFMLIPRSIELIIYITCAILIYRRRKEYYLNKVYTISLIGWCFYVLGDMLFHLLGHLEPSSWGLIDVGGELMELPIITNMIRDIATIGGATLAFGFLYASLLIRYGENKLKEKKSIIIFTVTSLTTAILVGVFDNIIRTQDKTIVSTNVTPYSLIFILVEVIIYLFGVYTHLNAYNKIDESRPEKKRILLFILQGMAKIHY